MKQSYDFGTFSGNKLLLVEDRYDNIDYEQCLTNKLTYKQSNDDVCRENISFSTSSTSRSLWNHWAATEICFQASGLPIREGFKYPRPIKTGALFLSNRLSMELSIRSST